MLFQDYNLYEFPILIYYKKIAAVKLHFRGDLKENV